MKRGEEDEGERERGREGERDRDWKRWKRSTEKGREKGIERESEGRKKISL